jgi:tape measure domain-containing protein
MANNTVKFDIKAAIDTRGLDEFQSQLGELRSTAEPLDRVLGDAVKSIKEWASASRLSERNTAAATSAIDALTRAMTAGGNEWKKGTQAAKDLNTTLRETTSAANAARAALAAPARTTIGANQQISDLRKGLQELTIGSSQYLAMLQQITEREALLGRRTGRAGVVAANQAFEGALLTRGYGAAENLQQMPNTTAALRQRLSELSQELPNLLRGSQDYLRAAREMRDIERELSRDISRSTEQSNALAAARRRLADATRANSASGQSGFAAFSSSIADNLAVQRSIERNQRRQEQRTGMPFGAVPSAGYNVPIGPVAPTELLRSIDGIGASGATAKLQTLGRSYQDVAARIRETAQAAGGSTRALQAERQAWEQLQASVAPASREYKQAGREMQRLDRQLGTSTRGERFLESAGAISAGAFFGGPEGLIGGIGGMVIGGPGAALGGAAIGAQLGIVRKAIGDAASYSAELAKLRIALQGVTGSGQEYAKALEIVGDASSRLNITQEDALRGFTRLSASVVGAGGSVSDAKIVFEGVNTAIKATGGSSQDAQAALLALSQVFSKGKVSAEELSGQLGERLAGAVTLFANATGRTLPQLNKDLQNGVVGLNDVIKFTEALGNKYESTSDKIAQSTEEAGARQTVALNKFREELGKLFGPLGSTLQDSATRFLNWSASIIESFNKARNAAAQLRNAQAQNPTFSGRSAAEEAQRLIDSARRNSSAPRPSTGLFGLAEPTQRYRNVEVVIDGKKFSGSATSVKAQIEQYLTLKAVQPAAQPAARPRGGFPDPSGDENSKKAERDAEKAERKRQEEAARQQRLDLQLYNDRVRLDEQIAENKIRLEDRVFQYRQELLRREREQQLQLDQLRQQTFVAGLSPEGRNAVAPLQELLQRLQGFGQERQALSDAVEAAKQAVKSAKEMAANRERFGAMYMEDAGGVVNSPVSGPSVSGVYIQGGIGPRGRNQYGPHYDIARMDGGYFDRRALDQWVMVNGRPISRGLTVSGGQFGASRDGGARVHRAWDYAFGGSAQLSLSNGARWVSSKPGSYGDNTVFETPDGQRYRIIHGTFQGRAQPLPPPTTTLANNRTIRTPGAASAALRAAGASGDVMGAQAELTQAQAMLDAYDKSQGALTSESAKLAITQLIQPLRDQNQALKENYQEWQTRTRLEMEGVKPELIEFEIQKTRILNEQAKAEAALREQLVLKQDVLIAALGQAEYDKQVNELFQEREQLTLRLIRGAEQLAQAQADPALAFERRMRELNQSLRDFNNTQELALNLSDQFSGNLASGFSSAVSSIVTGNGTVQQSFADLFNNIAKMFLDTISRVLADQATQWIMQLLKPPAPAANTGGVAGLFSSALPMLAPAESFGFGGSVAGLFSPSLPTLGFATGGISRGPTSGYPATLHGTEAVVPLPNGRAIPVEMTGGGTSVVVNVNMATGEMDVSSGERDGELLGKALSEAVQAELIRQKRPGGILYR